MKQKLINETHIEGYLYQHSLALKTSSANSKNPGTQFINGTIDIATDDALTNIVSIHYTYVTQKTSKGNDDSRFATLQNIINGTLCSVMEHGADRAAKLRIDSAIALNEFYSNRSGSEELVSQKRNEGGFIHVTQTLASDENLRSTFKTDMLITKTTRLEADEEKNLPEKMKVSGYIFDFRKAILPVDFTVLKPKAMDYFESLEISSKNPFFTQVSGIQVSQVVKSKKISQSAFGEPLIEESTSTQRDFVITWATENPYEWDSEEGITAAEFKEAEQNRNLYLAEIKTRQDEYNAAKAGASAQTTPVANASGFNF